MSHTATSPLVSKRTENQEYYAINSDDLETQDLEGSSSTLMDIRVVKHYSRLMAPEGEGEEQRRMSNVDLVIPSTPTSTASCEEVKSPSLCAVKESTARKLLLPGVTPDKNTRRRPETPLNYVPPPGWILYNNFLGKAPTWYKTFILSCLVFNPIFMLLFGKFVAGWLITLEFIFTLTMALRCYPLQPGGLLVLESVVMGLVTTHSVYQHLIENLHVLLLVIFMVTGIHFMREFLMAVFTNILLAIPDKLWLSLGFMTATAFFSAWLDALTVTAVIMNAFYGFYCVYLKVAMEESRFGVEGLRTPNKVSPMKDRYLGTTADEEAGLKMLESDNTHSKLSDFQLEEFVLSSEHLKTLDEFRDFLRSLLMHALIGTAVGGTFTLIGEPQNLLIGQKAGWNFTEYFVRCAPVSILTFITAILICVILERIPLIGKRFGYGAGMPTAVREVLDEYSKSEKRLAGHDVKAMVIVQVFVGLLIIYCLGTHVAAVGLIGLTVIILLTSFNGIIDEAKLGHAFSEAMPFTALLVVFFAVAGIIEENQLFQGLVDKILHLEGVSQIGWLFAMDGILSTVSDNVFVATLYINAITRAWTTGTISHESLNILAVVINVSTNIPSIATPNGQAAFLFLYTSKLAPLVQMTYLKMVWMALPYTLILTSIALLLVLNLGTMTGWLVSMGLLANL